MGKYDNPCCDFCGSENLLFNLKTCKNCASPIEIQNLSDRCDELHMIIASLRLSIAESCGEDTEVKFMIKAEYEAKQLSQ